MHRLGWKDEESTNPADTGNFQSKEVVCEPPRLPKYIHWCVDTADRRTFMDHICIEEKQGPAFVEDLIRKYKARRGWRWLFSLTTCAEIKLVKVSSSSSQLSVNFNNHIQSSSAFMRTRMR